MGVIGVWGSPSSVCVGGEPDNAHGGRVGFGVSLTISVPVGSLRMPMGEGQSLGCP